MKNSIIERLLSEGHITIPLADSLLNNRSNKTNIIELLLEDGQINHVDAITLLRDYETPSFPFDTPNQKFPVMPLTYPPNYHDWTWDPNQTGTPSWTITCSTDLNKNHGEK